MTLYTQEVILNIPTQKREVNDYEIQLTVKNSSLNVLIQKKNDLYYYESNFNESELQKKFKTNFSINYIYNEICNIIDNKEDFFIEENKYNLKLIFTYNNSYTELIVNISLKQLSHLMAQLNNKTNFKDFAIISLLILVLFINVLFISIFIINNNNKIFNNNEDDKIKLINSTIKEFNDKKIVEINQSLNNISDRFSNLETIHQKYLNYKENISEIDKSINEKNNSINELKENNSKETNNKIEQLNETINNKIEQLNEKINNTIKQLNETINNKIEELNETIDNKIEQLNETIHNISNTKSIYSITTLNYIDKFKYTNYQLNSIAIFKSNKIIVVYNKNFIILDENFNIIQTINNAHNDYIYYVDIYDENNFVTSSDDKSIKTWIKNNNKYSTNKIIQNAHTKKINKVIYNSKGNLISCSWDGLIKIWELNNEEYINIKTLNHTNDVKSILLLEDKNILISSGNGTKFWNITNNEILFSDDNSYTIWNTGLERINDDKIVVCNNNDNKSLIIYSISQLKIIKIIDIDFECISIKSIKNKNIFLVGEYHDIYIYDSDNYYLISHKIEAHDARITRFEIFKKNYILSSSYDSFIKTWFINTSYFEKVYDIIN